jgi:cytochrome c biogenesis protein
LTVAGVTIVVDAIVGAAGLELKADPGVPYVYAGFGGLMVSTLVSYLSHSQVWALQTRDGTLHVAGRTNRAALGFGAEFDAALAAVPERDNE